MTGTRALFVLAAAWLLTLHMMLLAGAAPVERRVDIHVSDWPADARPLRLALLSDTHPSWPGDAPSRLRETVARVNAARPDAVLLAGDYRFDGLVWRRYPLADALAPLAGLRAPLGVYAVLGNHDMMKPIAILATLAGYGIVPLWNEAARIGPLALLGIADATTSHEDIAHAVRSWRAVGGVPVVFTHSPDVVPKLPPTIALVLAGHTHCGQVRLPLFGAPFTESRYGSRFACGVIREGGRTIVVGAGLGTSGLPIRLGAEPDFWLVTIGP